MPKTKAIDGPPSDATLTARLGGAGKAFERLLAALPGVRQEWRVYSRSSGWVLKLVQGTRTMCYVQPGDGFFRATVVLGEAAAASALESPIAPSTKDAIRSARAYVEGRSVSVEVHSADDLRHLLDLLEAKQRRVAAKRPSPRGR
jgi:hypothetical protein